MKKVVSTDTDKALRKNGSKRPKRRDARQYSIHISRSIRQRIKLALLLQGDEQDFSGLVEELLTEYLSKQRLNLAQKETQPI